MNRSLDFNKLMDWAQSKEIWVEITHDPSNPAYTCIQTGSAAPIECYYYKNCSSTDTFIEAWEANFRKGMKAQMLEIEELRDALKIRKPQ